MRVTSIFQNGTELALILTERGLIYRYGSSHQTCSIQKGAPKNFAKFREKHL